MEPAHGQALVGTAKLPNDQRDCSNAVLDEVGSNRCKSMARQSRSPIASSAPGPKLDEGVRSPCPTDRGWKRVIHVDKSWII